MTFVLFKFVLLALGVAAVAYLILARRPSILGLPKPVPSLKESIRWLLTSQDSDAFLVISISGTDDFLQMKPAGSGVELDYPQITERQKELRAEFERVCQNLRLPVRISHRVAYLILARRPSILGLPKPVPSLKESIRWLLTSQDSDAFLVISISGTDDFLQMKPAGSGVELDYPQITERQKELRAEFERVCQNLRLPVRISHGSDGSQFLDVDIKGSEEEITSAVRTMMVELFGFTDTQELEFEFSG